MYDQVSDTCKGIEETEFPQGGEICPVCGKIISRVFLPDPQGFIKERLYQSGDVRIVSSTTLKCDFYHFYDEDEDMTLHVPHLLTALVQADFNQKGQCIAFDILEIRPVGR